MSSSMSMDIVPTTATTTATTTSTSTPMEMDEDTVTPLKPMISSYLRPLSSHHNHSLHRSDTSHTCLSCLYISSQHQLNTLANLPLSAVPPHTCTTYSSFLSLYIHHDIDDNLIAWCFSMLDLTSLTRARRVCHHWKTIISTSPICWTTQHIKLMPKCPEDVPFPNIPIQANSILLKTPALRVLSETITPSLFHLQHLDLSACRLQDTQIIPILRDMNQLRTINLSRTLITDQTLERLVISCPHITTLDLSLCEHITNAGMKHLSHALELTTLDLIGCRAITDDGLIALIPTSASHHVDLSCEDTARRYYHTSNITVLRIGWINITDQCLSILARGMPNITTLGICQCHELTTLGYELLSNFSLLTKLTVGGRTFKSQHLYAISELITLLELDIFFPHYMDDDAFRYLSKLENMHTLRLDGCYQLHETCIASLAPLPKLTTLAMRDCNITDVALHNGLPKCLSLTSLNISRNYQITNHGIQALYLHYKSGGMLQYLNLSESAPHLTYDGIKILHELSTLHTLNISACDGIPDESRSQFKNIHLIY